MENPSSVNKHGEDFIKTRNLLFSMDYDSGYISHNPESNLDFSLENIGHSTNSLSSKPIYLSEDALLETPEFCKYPNISAEMEKETVEETRNVFNSPIRSTSTTYLSGSTESGRSQSLIYSGFNSDYSDVSPEIACAKNIILNASAHNNTHMYNVSNSSDFHDLKKESDTNVHQTKMLVFNNITNTLATNDSKKNLTLIFSKSDKENVYIVKRKYNSLTPPHENSNCILTQREVENECSVSPEKHETETTTYESNSVLEEQCLESKEEECLRCAKCNANISEENTSLEESINVTSENGNFNIISINNPTTENKQVESNEKLSNLYKLIVSEAVNEEFEDKANFNVNSTVQQSEDFTKYEPDKECKIFSSRNDLFIKSNDYEILPNAVQTDSEILIPNVQDDLNKNETDFIKQIPQNSTIDDWEIKLTAEESKSENIVETHENSLKIIKSVVSETLRDLLNNLINSDVKDCVTKNTTNITLISSEDIKTKNINCDNSIVIKRNNERLETSDIKTEKCITTSIVENPNKTITSTPEKSYIISANSSLSPDLFIEDVIEEKSIEETQPTTSTPKEKNVVKKDYMILRRAQNNIKGVIPPRSLTMIKMSTAEMLNKIECNKKYFWSTSTSTRRHDEDNSKSLLITSSAEKCKSQDFPEILKDRCLGLYHNRSKFSEEFEELCVKYGQRYVGAETQSSCTVFETVTVSPTKRRNIKSQWTAKSPGKRLSHLARRRITFSSANLQSGSSFLAGSRARQILVDAKKIDLLSRRKSPRKSPRKTPKKTPRKSPRLKTRTPSSSAKKKLALRFRKLTGEIEKSSTNTSFEAPSFSAKRNLFSSPDENKKPNRFLPSTSGTSTLDELKKSTSKRALFMSPSKSSPLKNMGFKKSPVKRLYFGLEKKRKRNDSIDELPSKFPRCHSEMVPSTETDVKMLSGRTRSEFSLSENGQTKELTTNHKKKLQLAIYEALRSQNILPIHPQFKTFASNLGRLTRKLFLMTTADCVGVTEKMLRIARHHVFSVVKGKSPEEIFEQFMKQKSKTLKPQGYIAPKDSVSDKIEPTRRALLLGKPIKSENKIDRIRKAINFGDDDNT